MSAKAFDPKKIDRDWLQNEKYRENIAGKKESGCEGGEVLDYSRLAKKREVERKREFSFISKDKGIGEIKRIEGVSSTKSRHNKFVMKKEAEKKRPCYSESDDEKLF